MPRHAIIDAVSLSGFRATTTSLSRHYFDACSYAYADFATFAVSSFLLTGFRLLLLLLRFFHRYAFFSFR